MCLNKSIRFSGICFHKAGPWQLAVGSRSEDGPGIGLEAEKLRKKCSQEGQKGSRIRLLHKTIIILTKVLAR